MPRKKTFQVFREARKGGAHDERPMLPDDIDLQLHLSRNDRPQPFYLICGKDTLIAQLSGSGRVEFKQTSVKSHPLKPGDYVYVPAGTPHRLVPETESVTVRYKAAHAGLEGIAWYCLGCDAELHREVWDTAATISHAAYHETCLRFNAEAALRTCASCGEVHPDLDLAPYAWDEIAKELQAEAS